ncbi:MAG: hypothetical protein KDN05_02650 [Verrucomicrobiae bacterium]|nr:hypothetical protein [Verrucomicrobiae bacterium]
MCDFSQAAVEQGLTHPEAIRSYLDAGVEVHSWANLHAKVYAFGDVAIVGSCNASARSANTLTEAAVRITDPTGVQQCSDFVLSLRGDRVLQGLVEIRTKQYPKIPAAGLGRVAEQSPLWVAVLKRDASEAAQARAVESDEETSKLLSSEEASLNWFEWSGRFPDPVRQQVGEIIMRDLSGRFHAPGRFLRLESVPGKNSFIVWIEQPEGALPISTSKAKRMLGPEIGTMLESIKSSGLIRNREFAKRLRQLW